MEAANDKDVVVKMCKPKDNAPGSMWEDLIFEYDEESITCPCKTRLPSKIPILDRKS